MLSLLIVMGFMFSSCQVNEKQLREALKKNPDILTDAIKENPSAFIDALNEAVKSAQGDQAKKREEEEKKQLEESFNNPNLNARIQRYRTKNVWSRRRRLFYFNTYSGSSCNFQLCCIFFYDDT